MKVSVLIPIYNVASYLGKCLSSAANQRYRDLEIIMVNDGSTDSSAEVAQTFVKKDERFRLVSQENKGLSGARNTGLHYVTGDYVFYLDADDYLTENAIKILIEAAEKHQADIVQGNFYYDYPDHLLLNKQQKEKEVVYSREEAMWALLEHKTVLNFAWGKLIKTELAKQFQFPEGKYFEDTFWMSQIIHCCARYVALNKPVLYYLQRTSGISGGFSIRNLDQLEGEVQRITFIQQHYPKNYVHQALRLLNKKIILHTSLLKSLQEEEANKYREKLKEIEIQFGLRGEFPFEYNKLYQFLKKIQLRLKNKVFETKDWEKINKGSK